MTTFDDRERAYEAKFAHDEELNFRAEARRNRLVGEWAAALLGKTGDDARSYALTIVSSDFDEPGDEDVFRKVAGDFKGAGLSVSDGEIYSKMDELASVARDEIRAGD